MERLKRRELAVTRATFPENDELLIKQETDKNVTVVVWDAADNLLVTAVVWDAVDQKSDYCFRKVKSKGSFRDS